MLYVPLMRAGRETGEVDPFGAAAATLCELYACAVQGAIPPPGDRFFRNHCPPNDRCVKVCVV